MARSFSSLQPSQRKELTGFESTKQSTFSAIANASWISCAQEDIFPSGGGVCVGSGRGGSIVCGVWFYMCVSPSGRGCGWVVPHPAPLPSTQCSPVRVPLLFVWLLFLVEELGIMSSCTGSWCPPRRVTCLVCWGQPLPSLAHVHDNLPRSFPPHPPHTHPLAWQRWTVYHMASCWRICSVACGW